MRNQTNVCHVQKEDKLRRSITINAMQNDLNEVHTVGFLRRAPAHQDEKFENVPN